MNVIKNPVFSLSIYLLLLLGSVFSLAFAPKQKSDEGNEKKCLIVSDIHFNPMFGSADTALRSKLLHASFDDWKKMFLATPAQMALDVSMLGKDADYAVLRSAVSNMKRVSPHPAFILIAGDFIWHNATIGDSTLKKKTIQFIAQLFKEEFPGVAIIPGLGNNDTYGADYAMQDAKFLNDFADAWEPALPKAAIGTLKADGYYTCNAGGLKLVVINSALLNYKTNYPQAGVMLKWLESSLSQTGGEKIWIMSHIPPGINAYNNGNFWNPGYTAEFVKTVVKNAGKIKLIIGSHTHFDDFKVVYDAAGKPISYLRIVPSVCSNHGNNPSFIVASYEEKTGTVVHETNHYLDLAEYPKGKNASIDVAWNGRTELPAALHLKNISASSFSNLITNIKNDQSGQALTGYVNFYNVGTAIDSTHTINHTNLLNYLKADSLKEK